MLETLAQPSTIYVIVFVTVLLITLLYWITNNLVNAMGVGTVIGLFAVFAHFAATFAVDNRAAAEAVTDETTAPFLADYRECAESLFGDTKTECKARIIENVEDLEGGDTAEAVKNAITAYETRLEQ